MPGGYIGDADIVVGADASGIAQEVSKQAQAQLAAVGKALGKTLSDGLREQAQAGAKRAADALQKPIAAVVAPIKSATAKILEPLQQQAQAAKAKIQQLGAQAKSSFGSAVAAAQQLPGPLGAFANQAVAGFAKARDGLKQFAEGFKAPAIALQQNSTLLQKLGATAGAAATAAGAALKSGLLRAAEATFEGLKSGAQKAWDALKKGAAAAAKTTGAALKTGIGVAAKATAGIIAGAVGTMLAKGFKRLKDLNEAEARLKGLGVEGKKLTSIMSSVDAAVTGTAFGLGDAAKAAALLSSSGVKAGKSMDNSMQALVATAAAAGAELGDITPIYQKMAAQGKVGLVELSQLTVRGVNATGSLQKSLGKTATEIRKMASAGQISFEMFTDAINGDLNMLAAAMGGTLDGMVKNVGAQMGRIGAEVQKPLFNALLHAMPGVLEGFRNMAGAVKEFMEPFAESLIPMAERFGDAVKRVSEGISGEGIGSFFSALAPLTPLLGALLPLLSSMLGSVPLIGPMFGKIPGPVGLALGALVAFTAINPETMAAGFENLAASLPGIISSIASTVMNVLPGMISNLAGNIPVVIEGLGQVLAAALTGLAAELPGMVSGILTALISSFSSLASSLPAAIDGLVAAFAELIPKLGEMLVTLTPTLIEGLSTAIMALVGALPTLLQSLFEAIVTLAPMLLEAGMQLFTSLVESLVTVGPQLIQQLIQVGMQLITQLLSMLPQLLQMGIKLFMQLALGVIQAIPEIVSALVELLPELLTTLVEMIPALIQGAIDLFLALVTGLGEALPEILTALVDILPSLIESLIGMIPTLIEAAIQLFLALVEAIPQALPQIITAIIDMAPKLVEAVIKMVPKLLEAGVQLITGLAKGIMQAAGAVMDAIGSVVNGAIDWAKGLLGIKSPSRVFAAIGKQVGAGLSKGVVGSVKDVQSATTKLVNAMTAAFKKNGGATRAQARLLANVKAQNKTLVSMAKQREKIAEQLAAANDDLEEQIGVRDNWVQQIRIGIRDLGNVAQFTTPQSMVRNLNKQIKATQQFNEALEELTKLGVDETTLEQLVSDFAQNGSARAAQKLAAGGADMVAQVAELQKQLNAEAKKVASRSGEELYQAGIDAARGLVEGLESQDAALVAAAKKIADSITKTVKKTLGIKSPSKVMAALGDNTVEGFLSPLKKRAGEVMQAMNSLVSPDGLGLASAFGVSGMTGMRLPSATTPGTTSTTGIGRQLIFEEGAIKVEASTSPEKTAQEVVDRIAEAVDGGSL